jgi:hypothetical protein
VLSWRAIDQLKQCKVVVITAITRRLAGLLLDDIIATAAIGGHHRTAYYSRFSSQLVDRVNKVAFFSAKTGLVEKKVWLLARTWSQLACVK